MAGKVDYNTRITENYTWKISKGVKYNVHKTVMVEIMGAPFISSKQGRRIKLHSLSSVSYLRIITNKTDSKTCSSNPNSLGMEDYFHENSYWRFRHFRLYPTTNC